MEADSGGDYEDTVEALQTTLREARITAEPEVVMNTSAEAIIEQSANAAMVFIPFRLRGDELVAPFVDRVENLLARLNISVMGLAAEDIELDAEPEEGKVADIAATLDVFTHVKSSVQTEESHTAAENDGNDADNV